MKRRAIKRWNPERAARVRAEDFGEQATRCRISPCCACTHLGKQQFGPSDPHHEPPRSLGGTDKDTVPLCRPCHRKRHDVGSRAFWEGAGLDPATIVENYRTALYEIPF